MDSAIKLWEEAEKLVKDDPARLFNVRLSEYSPVAMRLRRLAGHVKTAWASRHPERFAVTGDLSGLFGKERAIRVEAAARGLVLHHSHSRPTDQDVRRYMAALERCRPGVVSDRAVIDAGDCYFWNGDYSGGPWNEREGLYARIVRDEEAEDGRALQVLSTHDEQSANFQFSHLAFDPEGNYRVRIRVRGRRISTEDGEVFRAVLYGTGKAQELSLKASQLTEGYAWHEIGRGRLSAGGLVTFGPGRYDRGGGSHLVSSIHVDSIDVQRE